MANVDKKKAYEIRDEILAACHCVYKDFDENELWMFAMLNAETFFKAKSEMDNAEANKVIELFRRGCSAKFIAYCMDYVHQGNELAGISQLLSIPTNIPRSLSCNVFELTPEEMSRGFSPVARIHNLLSSEISGTRKMLEAGYSLADIAKEAGCLLEVLAKQSELKISPMSMDMYASAVRWQHGYSIRYIATVLHIDVTNVINCLRYMNCCVLRDTSSDFNITHVNGAMLRDIAPGKYSKGNITKQTVLCTEVDTDEVASVLRSMQYAGYGVTEDSVAVLLNVSKKVAGSIIAKYL